MPNTTAHQIVWDNNGKCYIKQDTNPGIDTTRNDLLQMWASNYGSNTLPISSNTLFVKGIEGNDLQQYGIKISDNDSNNINTKEKEDKNTKKTDEKE